MTPEELAEVHARTVAIRGVRLIREADYLAMRRGLRLSWHERNHCLRKLGQGARALARARKQSGAA